MTLHDPFDIEVARGVVSGVLHHPSGDGPAPVVLFCGDLPGSLADRSGLIDALVMRLNASGIAAAEFAPRPVEPSASPSAAAVREDAAAVLDRLRVRDDLDPRRIGLFGSGLGAVVAAGLAARGDGVNRVCLHAPVTVTEAINRLNRPNGVEPLLHPQSIDDVYRESLAILSPLDDIAAHDRPTLILHGAADRLVPPACARPYVEAIEKAGHRVEREIIAFANHLFSAPEARSICVARVERFFSKMTATPAAVAGPVAPAAAAP